MPKKNLYIYTDASFDRDQQLGVAGFILFQNTLEHETGDMAKAIMSTAVFEEKNNIRVELKGCLLALESISEKPGLGLRPFSIELYTDCSSISGLAKRRERLESSNYISKRSKSPLTNADLYRRLFVLCDGLLPHINLVKGHSPKNNTDLVQRNFGHIDRIVRAKLRSLVNMSNYNGNEECKNFQ